jgi:diguanylate cyclase
MVNKQIRTFSENEIIFREGEEGDFAYLIDEGRILVYLTKDGVEIPLKIIGKGEIFGEMSMIDNSVRSASCRALTDVRLAIVTREQLIDRVLSADPIVRLLLRALLDRLRLQNDAIRGHSIMQAPLQSEAFDNETQAVLNRISQENRIALALKNDEFLPYYQPIYDLETQKVKGCEALLRWVTPEGEVIPPGTFIDALEQSPMILNVGQLMIRKCLTDLATLQERFRLSHDFFISINVSGRQFADPNFVDQVEKLRNEAGVNAHHVKLEVTERIMTEGPSAINTFQKCHSLGYKLAIDDFGTGFSSLQYLAAMPLDDLKVDRSFVSQMITQERSLSIVKTLIHLGELLSLNLIAEGIETTTQLEALKNLGVQMGQGFLFSKAIPFLDFVKKLEEASSLQRAA